MKIYKIFFIALFFCLFSFSKGIELSPETFASAQLIFTIDKTIKLSEKNKFRFPVVIDANNRCLFSSKEKKINLSKNTEWKSESTIDWNDWDSKTFHFKLTSTRDSVQLTCELNLSGELLLFNSGTEKKSAAICRKQGGQVQNSPPKSYTRTKSANSDRAPASQNHQTYCVKRIPKVSLSKFKKAFQTAKMKVHVEYAADPPPAAGF